MHVYFRIAKLSKSTFAHRRIFWAKIKIRFTSFRVEMKRADLFSLINNVYVPKNHLSLAYLLHAYDVSDSTFRRLRSRNGAPLEKQVPHNKNKSVLLDPEYASTHYTGRFFYVQHKMKMWTRENPGASSDRKASMRKSWRGNWDYEKSTDESFGAVFGKKGKGSRSSPSRSERGN